MTITTTHTETKEVTRDIETPYYSRERQTFYRINENGSVTKVFNQPTYFSITTVLVDDSYNKVDLSAALKAELSTHREFMEAMEDVRQKMENAMVANS